MPGSSVFYYLPEFAQIHVHWVGDAIYPSHPLLPSSPFPFNYSQLQGLFQWVGFSYQGPEYWSFSFSLSPSSEYSGLISFRIDWFDLLVVQGTLKSLPQHHTSKASILQLFMVQHSHPYMILEKPYLWLIWTFVNKMMSLLLNTLSTFAITFLPKSKCYLILWLQSPPALILVVIAVSYFWCHGNTYTVLPNPFLTRRKICVFFYSILYPVSLMGGFRWLFKLVIMVNLERVVFCFCMWI